MQFAINAAVVGSVHLGIFEAETKEEALAKCFEQFDGISFCHQCADQCEDPDIDEDSITVTPVDDREAADA